MKVSGNVERATVLPTNIIDKTMIKGREVFTLKYLWPMKTRVNPSIMQAKKKPVKSPIKSKGRTLYLSPSKSSLNIKLNDVYGVNVQSMVEKYIAKDRASSLRDTRKTMEDSWTNYSQSIKKPTNERKYMLLPEILATDFGNPELYKPGQPGYNSKYYDVTNK